MYVIRSRAGGSTDTIGRIPSEYASIDPTKPTATVKGLVAGGATRSYRVSLQDLDQMLMFPDGWTAIARTNPYRVDWCAPRGACRAGAVIEPLPATISDEDKRAHFPAAHASGGWPEDMTMDKITAWPPRLPPFAARVNRFDHSPLMAMADGNLLIERVASTAAPARQYDVIDREGVRVSRFKLPVHHEVVSAGQRWLYVAVTNDDGVQRLTRHRWP
jgi:hypothetical protein